MGLGGLGFPDVAPLPTGQLQDLNSEPAVLTGHTGLHWRVWALERTCWVPATATSSLAVGSWATSVLISSSGQLNQVLPGNWHISRKYTGPFLPFFFLPY